MTSLMILEQNVHILQKKQNGVILTQRTLFLAHMFFKLKKLHVTLS